MKTKLTFVHSTLLFFLVFSHCLPDNTRCYLVTIVNTFGTSSETQKNELKKFEIVTSFVLQLGISFKRTQSTYGTQKNTFR